jgi:hypothetical protein
VKTIYRFDVAANDRIPIPMPKGARLLSVQPSDRITYGVTLWALVDTAAEQEIRHIYAVGTGNPLPETGLAQFLGTVNHGTACWHVFAPAPIVGSSGVLQPTTP